MALVGKVEEFQENDNWIEYKKRLEHFLQQTKSPISERSEL